MPYALNIKRGTTINHPDVTLPGLVAVPITDKLYNQLKNIINVVVFDRVMGIKDNENSKSMKKSLYNLEKTTKE